MSNEGRTDIHLVFADRADAGAARDKIDANAGLPKPDEPKCRMICGKMQDDDATTIKTWAKIRTRYPDGKYFFRKAPDWAMRGVTAEEYNYTEEKFDPIWTTSLDEQLDLESPAIEI